MGRVTSSVDPSDIDGVGASAARGVVATADRTPDRVAVRDDDGTMTFTELDVRVGALAARLAEDLADRTSAAPRAEAAMLPIFVTSDRWSVVAVHAAVRAGVPFVPLDPGLPPRVVADLIARLGDPRSAVVTGPDQAALLPTGIRTIPVSRAAEVPGRVVAPQPVDPDTVATVVFTSGSTGRPKGVVFDWALLEARHSEAEARDSRHADGTAMDAAVMMPLHWIGGLGRVLALGAGASATLTARRLTDPVELLEWFDASGVTAVSLLPSLAQQLAGRWPDGRRLEAVREVSFGGEGVRWEQVPPVRRLVARDAVVQCNYGASEGGGIRVLSVRVGPDDALGTGPLPLGQPVSPGRARFEPVGEGDGLCEIVVCGAVARGYLDDPERTESQFGRDADGVRWWRSGDLVRRSGDDLYHAGRVDDVVKVNGKLVAPAESEALLAAMPGVDAVAVVPHDGASSPRLVAHLVVDDRAGMTPDLVFAHTRERLAAHVVPHVLMRHDALPLLPNGKVDRVALRALAVHPWRTTAVRGADTALERWCLDEVRRITRVDDVGPDDDLFTVGLDSLGAVELCSAISDSGRGQLDPSDLVECRTVAAICARLQTPPAADSSTAVTMNPSGTRPPVFLLPAGGGGAFGFRYLGEAVGPDQPLVTIEPRGLHQRGRPDRTLAALVAHAGAEIGAQWSPTRPLVIVGYSASGPIAFEVARRMAARGHRPHLVLLDAAPSYAVLEPEPTSGSVSAATKEAAAEAAADPRPPGADVAWRARLVGHWRGLRRRWFVRVPGRPRFDIDRYLAFSRITHEAIRGHVPEPADFPVTVLEIAGGGAGSATRPFARDLVVRPIGGTHRSMLQWPHVAEIARVLDEIVRDAERRD